MGGSAEQATYDVTLSQPISFDEVLYNQDGIIATVAGGGVVQASGQFTIAQSATLPGDADGDGDVDFTDYQILEGEFGENGTGPYAADFNNNNAVDFADYQILEGNFATSMPEPATLGMLLLGGLALLRRRPIPTPSLGPHRPSHAPLQ